jgi:beta-xylosidase
MKAYIYNSYRILLLLAAIGISVTATAQNYPGAGMMKGTQFGSWGDQGDGTFKNPVLNSNYPDSDVEKLGDKWYMISSKGRYIKGMTILESEDLVNWSVVGGVVDSVDWYTGGQSNGEGVWAGDLVYHNNRWFCYFIDIDRGLFVCTADDIKGSWSKPTLIMDKKGMTDPAVYFDSKTKQGYLICNYQIVGTGDKRMYHNRLFKLAWDGMRMEDDGRDIYVESGAEAAKIYQVNDYYYLFFSEWTTDSLGRKLDRRQIVLRSRDIAGPYEKKIVLERDPITGRSSSQGALIQAPNGSWWYLHQLIQSKNTFEGRPQCLIPVIWKEDWPMLGIDVDANGIGNTVWASKKPINGKELRAPQTDDDFTDPVPGPHWLWEGNPLAHLWSLTERKGYLRMYGADATDQKKPYESLRNKLMQRKMGKGKDTITTKMYIGGLSKGQTAGLIVTGYNHALVGVERDAASNQKKIYCIGTDGRKFKSESNIQRYDSVYLRTVLSGRKLSFAYSLDGKEFKEIGENYDMETRGFNGLFVGLFSKIGVSDKNGYADFDWFSYQYDGPKVLFLSKE